MGLVNRINTGTTGTLIHIEEGYERIESRSTRYLDLLNPEETKLVEKYLNYLSENRWDTLRVDGVESAKRMYNRIKNVELGISDETLRKLEGVKEIRGFSERELFVLRHIGLLF